MVKKMSGDGKEYDVSSTANAAVAPTNTNSIAQAVSTVSLKPLEAEFVTVVDYEWQLNSDKLSLNYLKSEYGYTDSELDTFLKTPNVLTALAERGSLPVGLVPGSDSITIKSKLTPIQLVAANKLLDLTDTRSNKKKLQDLGVSTTQYNSWLRDPEFSGYMQQRAENLIGDSQHEALLALMDKVNARDLKAIEFYMELTGRFTRQSNQANSGPDLFAIISRVVEVIIEEVDDPELSARIAERIRGLITSNQVAGALLSNDTIVQPEIAKKVELSPALQELVEKGAGYDG